MSDQGQKQDKVHEQDKTIRKRKILMKQKCNYIDHQISLNISKLDELMNMIKAKKQQQKGLSPINQVQQNNLNEENFPQIIEQKKKQVRKQRRLKFKYSIFRQYQFQQNQLQTIIKNDQQDKITSQSTMIENNLTNQQQLLLQGFSEHIKQTNKLIKFTKLQSKMSIMKELQFTEIEQIEKITIQTRYDWISNYLDREGNEAVVKGKSLNGQGIQVLAFNKKLDEFQCKIFTNLIKQKQLKQTLINYSYNQFIHQNPQLQISFPKHTQAINIIQSQIKEVIKLDLINSQKEIRILLKSQNQNINNMQRIMIFRQLPSTNSIDEKYKILWTKYDKQSFVQDVILQGGYNYLVTNLCCNPSSQVKLIFNPKDIGSIKIQKTKYDPWKSYNILCSSFQQCSKVFMSQNVFDDSKPLEFLRSNFLDYGLVLEIYQNIYAQKVAFLDRKQKVQNHEEDIQILFPQIYTQLQNKNIYLPQQLVIKFFEVTQKPARLYFPEKKVLIGSKIVQHVTIHATFK